MKNVYQAKVYDVEVHRPEDVTAYEALCGERNNDVLIGTFETAEEAKKVLTWTTEISYSRWNGMNMWRVRVAAVVKATIDDEGEEFEWEIVDHTPVKRPELCGMFYFLDLSPYPISPDVFFTKYGDPETCDDAYALWERIRASMEEGPYNYAVDMVGAEYDPDEYDNIATWRKELLHYYLDALTYYNNIGKYGDLIVD